MNAMSDALRGSTGALLMSVFHQFVGRNSGSGAGRSPLRTGCPRSVPDSRQQTADSKSNERRLPRCPLLGGPPRPGGDPPARSPAPHRRAASLLSGTFTNPFSPCLCTSLCGPSRFRKPLVHTLNTVTIATAPNNQQAVRERVGYVSWHDRSPFPHSRHVL